MADRTADDRQKFESDSRAVIGRLSKAISEVIGSLPQQIVQARQLERLLGVDYSLAWQALKVSTAPEAFAVGIHVPRPAPMDRLLRAAAKHGAATAAIENARAAYAEFESLVRRYAGETMRRGRRESGGLGGASSGGGRAAFDSMIAGMQEHGSPSLDLKHRRLAFRANSYIWGIQCSVRMFTCILHPGRASGSIDLLGLDGWIGLHATRPGAGLSVYSTAQLTHPPGSREDELAASETSHVGAPTVLREFTSPSALSLEEEQRTKQARVTRINLGGLGKSSQINVLMANRAYHVEQYDDPESREFAFMAMVTRPMEMLHLDMLIPAGWSMHETAGAAVFGDMDDFKRAAEERPEDRLPMRTTVEQFQGALEVPRAIEIPRYPEIVQRGIELAGVVGRRFDMYRLRVPYPVLHSMVKLSVRMNEMPLR